MNQALAISNNQQLVAMPNPNEWQVMREQATMLVSTGFLPTSIKTAEQALAIILQGRELGIPTMAALGTINVIQGKPTVAPQLMLALIERSGQLENIKYEADSDGVAVTMKRRNRVAHTEFFGTKEATELGLIGKDNYKKQAKTMFKWRAIAACARTVFPDVVLGLYTPDEMGANTDAETGEILSEPAQIHSLSTKSKLAVAADSAAPQPAVIAFSADESKMRDEIKNLSERIGKDSDQTIEYFDAHPDMRERCLRKVRTTFVKAAISSPDWGLTEEGTTEFLSRHGIAAIEDSTDAALGQAIEEIKSLTF